MKRSKNSQRLTAAFSSEKESVFKELIRILRDAGYDVRREKLKQGHGWKAVSGFCRLDEQRLIFVDQRLPQDEQITFLVQKIKSAGVELTQERLANLPPRLSALLQSDGTLSTAA